MGPFSFTLTVSVCCVFHTCLTLTHESLRCPIVLVYYGTTVPRSLKLVGETGLKKDLFGLYSHGFCVFQLALYLLAVSHSVCVCVYTTQFPLILKYLDGEMVKWFKAELGSSLFLCREPLVSVLTRGMSHYALPFTLKSILRQKKNYGNSNISTCKYITLKKSSKRNQSLSHYNSITNLKFQHKPKYDLSKILI